MAHDSHDVKQEFWKALAKSPFMMVKLDDSQDHALPMTAQLDKEEGPAHGGAVWFFTSKDNRLAAGGLAMAQFMDKGHDLFACVSGSIVEEKDEALIDRLWSPQASAWFEGGRQDPSLLALRFDLDDIEIWTADLGVVGLLKLMTGSKIDPHKAGEHVQTAV